jgi:hypothetical protein
MMCGGAALVRFSPQRAPPRVVGAGARSGLIRFKQDGSSLLTPGGFGAGLAVDEAYAYVTRCDVSCLLGELGGDCLEYDASMALLRVNARR